MESTQQAKIRRLQDMLIIAGDGVIAFSAWAMVKTALFFMLTDKGKLQEVFSVSSDVPASVIYIAAIIALCIDLAVRAFVGFSARSEGRGKKKSPFYLVVAVLAGMGNVYSGIVTALGMVYTLSRLDMVVSVVVEATALAALVTVVYCSVRLRRLNKATG